MNSATSASPCEQIAQQIGSLFVCSPHDDFVKVRTPFLYPDGDIVDLFLRYQGTEVALTDLGESMRWLRTQSVSMKKSPKQKLMISDVCMTLGVEFNRGMIVLKMSSTDKLADAILRLGQAAIRIADIYFTMRTRSSLSVTDEVEDFLSERSIPFQRGVSVTGSSGKDWNIDFAVGPPGRVSLVQILSTGSRAAAKGVIAHVFTSFTDIGAANDDGSRRRISVFDDTSDIWESGDYSLVERASDAVARWSKPDELEAIVMKRAA